MPKKPPQDTPLLTYGSNTLGCAETFYYRQKYRDFVYPTLGTMNYLDFWAEDKYYGRINADGYPASVKESSLKQLKNSQAGTLFALDFVADAWRDFVDRIQKLRQAGILAEDSPWANPRAAKAWRCAYDAYHDYMVSDVYASFADIYMTSQKNISQFTDMDSYLKVLTSFCEGVIRQGGPLTFSGFLESVYCSPLNTGLAIEISTDDHGTDLPKVKKYIYDDNYELVTGIASQYGFAFDKNAPWRLVADITNPAMWEYMIGVYMNQDLVDSRDDVDNCDVPILTGVATPEAYGFSAIPGLENVIRHAWGYQAYSGLLQDFNAAVPILFEGAYDLTWQKDMDILKLYLLDFHNRFVTSNPYSVTPRLPDAECPAGGTRVVERALVGENIFNSQEGAYGDKWALKAYYNLRLLEKGIVKSARKRTRELRDILNVYYFTPGGGSDKYFQALRYLQKETFEALTTKNLTNRTIGDINNR